MKKRGLQWVLTTALAGVLFAVPAMVQASTAFPKPLTEQVRHELRMLPYYTIFDNLTFQVDGPTVTLMGQVTDPVLKSDAGHVVAHIPGVEQVVNQIDVLPLSPMDNQLRWATYRAIYAFGPLQRYALGALPSIHIIVDNGHVTLEGVVANAGDRDMANLRANGVPGVFSVRNNLKVESQAKS